MVGVTPVGVRVAGLPPNMGGIGVMEACRPPNPMVGVQIFHPVPINVAVAG